MVYMSTMSGTIPEILVYKKIYKDKPSCQSVYQKKPQPFIDEISQLKPNATRISFSCVDRKLLMELKQNYQIKNL
tara:strand:+ start:902 stop:1126 length:225 start_codon:yes stop_codon:yes gene_type:complete